MQAMQLSSLGAGLLLSLAMWAFDHRQARSRHTSIEQQYEEANNGPDHFEVVTAGIVMSC